MMKHYSLLALATTLLLGTSWSAAETLTVSLPEMGATTIEAGASATLTPTVAGGETPYTYAWTDQAGNDLGSDATITVSPEFSCCYRLAVTSADGQTATAKTGVYVLGEQAVATFDDNYLAPESFFNGDNDWDEFYSGSYAFEVGNMIWPGSTISFWYGFALSNQTATTFNSLDDQYHGITGGGRNGSSNFVIAYPSGTDIRVTNNEEGEVITGMFVSPTAYSYTSMSAGDGYARAFIEGDYLKLVVTGTDANEESTSLDFYLGDYRSENEADRYILTDWEWVDLRPLGKVTNLSFVFEGSDVDDWGLKTAAYFALDDFGADRDLTEANTTVGLGASEIDLAPLFTLADDGSTVTYGLEVPEASERIATELDGSKLLVTATAADEMGAPLRAEGDVQQRVIVSATQRGHAQYVELTITLDAGTGVADLAAGRTVQSVQYVDLAGHTGNRPFDGVNVVVTRYTDGSATTTKIRH